MQDTPHDTIRSGIAILAESGDIDWDDGPFPVRGVALPEGITTNGSNTEDVETYWPADTVREAAALFEGAKIVDGSEHSAEDVLKNPQPSPETILGELTSVEYTPGVGVLYEGEVDDPEIAKRVDRGRVEVSPTLFRALGEEREDGSYPATDVKGVRDLSIVAEGAAEGNSIEPATAAMSALSAEALSATFGEDTPGDDPEGASTGGRDDAQTTTDPDATMSDDNITDDQRELLAEADRLDDPTVVESEHVGVLEAAADCEEPHVLEQSDLDALREETMQVRTIYAEALSEDSPFDAEALAEKFTTDELRDRLADDDGNVAPEALVQEPETGDPDDEEPAGLEGLSDEDREEAEAMKSRIEYWDGKNDTIVDAEKAKLVETLGVDSFDDVDMEAL